MLQQKLLKSCVYNIFFEFSKADISVSSISYYRYSQYLRQIEFKPKSDFSDPIKSICYDYSIECFYFIFKIGDIVKG